MDLDLPILKPADVAAAADINREVLRDWCRPRRGLIRNDTPGYFTIRRAYQVAITAELTRYHMQASSAARAAFHFTDTGAGPLAGRPERCPGRLFKGGFTVLVCHPDAGGQDVHDIHFIEPDTSALELLTPLGHHRAQGGVLLNLSDYLPRFLERLGLQEHQA